ncbi:S-adenosyl-L-methionine-dependent methyltransferase [Aspergillus ellipticus CBS 707.79]|uniref:S-adenosyl-L-methionine-dependent methyltransferase n=1 Tax=Aspergillus ellipticus CBS 707.79 TaxID=1448320 RepID=A0A319D2A2_9EURO|nr:S-adenosyl-L-methionine-dependent methyltransferase [Aspergillus ellipticus CBS 707.79]
MSVYYDAVTILTAPSPNGGSFKSRIYNARTIKSTPAQVYALIIETSKWDILLKEVIENAGILKLEPKLTPLLSLLLVHDHLIAKSGIAAKATHPLRQAVERHKARLRGEFIKARVRRGCATIPDLKTAIQTEKRAVLGPSSAAIYPRWVRVNNLRTTLAQQLATTFAGYDQVESLAALADKKIWIDPNVPDLLAIAPGVEISSSAAYRTGQVILQDKASCFPAYLLIGDEDWEEGMDLLDGCAAPGNKTTHMASLVAKYGADNNKKNGTKGGRKHHVFSMDQSPVRAKILQKMVSTAGADPLVTVLPGQDFLALDPEDPRFENVSGLLLDPSCSGSGIIGRDDVPKLVLPETAVQGQGQAGKKRKRKAEDGGNRDGEEKKTKAEAEAETVVQTPAATDENDVAVSGMDTERLIKLSNLQTRIVEHALAFPAATRVTYSTCSVHLLENEAVVQRILASEVARRRGWRVLRRDEQPEGMRKWGHRGERKERVVGDKVDEEAVQTDVTLSDEELEGCLRCWPGDDEGTGGFFVAGFVRDGAAEQPGDGDGEVDNEDDEEEDEEWGGFSD